jgi:hypothetical protein
MITNSYLIQYRDGKYSCIVNGQLIGDFENQIPMNQGYIGFVINGKQAVHFDNIKILYLGI